MLTLVFVIFKYFLESHFFSKDLVLLQACPHEIFCLKICIRKYQRVQDLLQTSWKACAELAMKDLLPLE